MVRGILDVAAYGDMISNVKIDVNISNLVKQKLPGYAAGNVVRDYFYVTDLVNPVFYYWSLKENVQTPPDIQNKLNYGNYIHSISKYWFERISGFRFAEANVAGGYVEIDGVSGKIDFQINDSIIELKTKEREVNEVDDVLHNFPQDLEQIVTYAGISSSFYNEHFLVFAYDNGSGQFSFNSFKITIRDLNGVREFIKKRIRLLNYAIKNGDPALLPRCRYYESGCKFSIAGKCNCSTLTHETGEGLIGPVTVSADPTIAATLKVTAKKYSISVENPTSVGLWDIILPAKKYHGHFHYDIDDEYIPDESYDKKAKVATIMSAVSRSDLAINQEESDSLRKTHTLDLDNQYAFIKIDVPSISNTKISVPYFVKVTDSKRVYSDNRLPPMYYAQAALEAVDSGSKCAVAIVDFKQRNDELVAYVIFPNSSKTFKEVKSVCNSLINGIRNGDASNIPKCPDFIRINCEYGSCSCKT